MEEQVTERMVIRASPAYCYQVLTDFERYPEWAADIKAVVYRRTRRQRYGPYRSPSGPPLSAAAPPTRCATTTAGPVEAVVGAGARRRHPPAGREL